MADIENFLKGDVITEQHSIKMSISQVVRERFGILIEGGNSAPGDSFIELTEKVAYLLRENQLEELILAPSEKKKIARYMSLLFAETHGKGIGNKAKKLYEDYFTPEEWGRFWSWAEEKHLH